MSEHQHVSRRTAVVGFYTLLSRIAGFVRDMVAANVLGASGMADAFYIAFRIPNLLRRFVAEGTLTVAFVPIFTDYLKGSQEKAREVFSVVFTYLSLLLTFITLAGIIFAPFIVKLIAWGFSGDPHFELTVFLTRIMFPYIFLISLVALSMGVLNSMNHFMAPAVSPVFLNLGMIIGNLGLVYFFKLPATAAAVGVLLGGGMQLLIQVPALKKLGMLPQWKLNWRHPAIKGLIFLMAPSALGAGIYQINVFVGTLYASFLPAGSVTCLWYADRIAQFPLGVFGISIATVVLPELSRFSAAEDWDGFKRALAYGLKLVFLITIPATVGVYLLAMPIVQIFFEHGSFDHAAAVKTAGALAMFSLQIPFVSATRSLVSAFFSLKDSKTPVKVSVAVMLSYIVFGYLSMLLWQHLGLALALSLSCVVNAVLLTWLLRRKIGNLHLRSIVSSLVRTSFATANMAAVVLLSLHFAHPLSVEGTVQQAFLLFAEIGIAVLSFVLAIRVLGPEEYNALMGMVRRKTKRA